jgi:hypothetical protein
MEQTGTVAAQATAAAPQQPPKKTATTAPSRPRWTQHTGQHAAFSSKARVIVVVAGRRWGKSELACMWLLAGAHNDRLRGKPSINWWVAPTYDMGRPIWRKMQRLAPPGWITRTVGSEAQPDFLELGGSRIEFKSADHPERLVAEGLGRVVVDECGIVKEGVWNSSLMPALIDHRAPAMLVGTPKGHNWFHRMYVRGVDPEDHQVASYGGPSVQNPFIDQTEVLRLAQQMPERLYRQELLAEFLSDEGQVFRGVRQCLQPLSPEPTVAVGIDLAKHHDFTVLVGMDRWARVTFCDRFREISWPLQKQRITAALERGGKGLLDSTGIGDPILDDLLAAGLDVEGYKFTNASKQQLVERLAMGIEQRAVGLPDDPVMLNELDVFEYDVGRTGLVRYSAPEGAYDDVVIALALAYTQVCSGGAYNLDILNS